MAKRKSSRKTTRRRSRRGMNGLGSITSSIMPILGLAGGAIASKMVSKALKPKDATPENKMLTQGVPVLAGFALSSFVKNPILKSVGMGMIVPPVTTFASEKLGIGADLMDDVAVETRIMENIMIGASDDINIAEDITIGAYGDGETYED